MKIITDEANMNEVLNRAVDTVYPTREALEEKLASGERLRVYIGIDPTSPTLHIGHAIQLRKLRGFQELGHEVILLIGSFTAMIGDPTGKSSTRLQLTQEEVMQNAATYKEQASKIIDFDGENPAQLKFNHEWLREMRFSDVIDLASHFTVQQMAERDMFQKRMQEGKPVHLHEFIYPLMQGYDSIAMDVDIEIGGSDQMFNMMAGRTLMKQLAKKEKFVVTTKLLENNEGRKMSKSEGGFIALSDDANDMFGKLMAMRDDMIVPYAELASDLSRDEIDGMRVQLEAGVNPRDVKAKLAGAIVTMYRGEEAAIAASEAFDQVFKDGGVPEEMDEFHLEKAMPIVDLLVASGLTPSKNEARRVIAQGGVKIDDVKIPSDEVIVELGEGDVIIQKGKRGFLRVKRT
ncbi:MAG: tyrosine--tRNA ligase [bacterium]|nr:tyrosine--tRNA ligase [bacterium]